MKPSTPSTRKQQQKPGMGSAPYVFKPLQLETKPSGLPILLAIQRLGKRVYEGSVPRDIIARRRIKNKMAKASRKQNRHG